MTLPYLPGDYYRDRELHFGCDWEQTRTGLYVPPGAESRPAAERKPIAIDLFAGAGGMSLGFHEAGWDVVAAVEWDAVCALTYLYNLGSPNVVMHFVTNEDERRFERAVKDQQRYERQQGTDTELWRAGGNPHRESMAGDGCRHYWLGDARKISGRDILDALGLSEGDVDAVTGGPPCQGFSTANSKRNVMDSRNSLVFEFCRLVLDIRPKTFVMENVPGMLSMVTPEGIPVVDAICRVMSDGGFGTFDALKRALLASSGAGAAMQGTGKVNKGRKAEEDKDEETASQIGLPMEVPA